MAIQTVARPAKYTKDEAARMIARLYRRLVMFQRMVIYRQLPGYLLCRDYVISPTTGALEIMSMHMIYNAIDRKCLHLRFTIFDYVTRKFTYTGTYELLENHRGYNVQVLYQLARPSLRPLPFERPPFRLHIGTLQSVINANLPEELPIAQLHLEEPSSSSSSSSSSSYSSESEGPVTPPPIIKVRPRSPGPEKVTIEIQTDWIEPEPADEVSVIEVEETIELPCPPPRKRLSLRWAVLLIQRRWRSYIDRKLWRLRRRTIDRRLLYTLKRRVLSACCGERHYTVQLWKHFGQLHEDQDRDFYYRLVATEDKSSAYYHYRRRVEENAMLEEPAEVVEFLKGCHAREQETYYHDVRLPEDPVLLRYYMRLAVVLDLDPESCRIARLELLRLKIRINKELTPVAVPEPAPYKEPSQLGCVLRHKFYLKGPGAGLPPGHLCKVYRRIRWLDKEKTRKYKDWKVKVLQEEEPRSMDYLVVHKLPCKLSQIEQFLEKTLLVTLEHRCTPHPIRYMQWQVGQSRAAYSQMYYDQKTSIRFNLYHTGAWYFS